MEKLTAIKGSISPGNISKKGGMGYRGQRAEDSTVARMKPAEYGDCTLLISAPVFRSSTQTTSAITKIYKKQGGWVCQRTEKGHVGLVEFTQATGSVAAAWLHQISAQLNTG